MAEKIQIGSGAPIYSERKYETYDVIARPVSRPYVPAWILTWDEIRYSREALGSMRLYIDAETGIVVSNISKYERSLSKEAS